MTYIEFKDYTKIINNKTILDHLNLSFEKGKIYGLLGHNGSGKTMFLRAICGLIKPTSGSVSVNGKVIGKDTDFSENTGIIIETLALIPEYNAHKNLKLLGKINNHDNDEMINQTIKQVGLDPNNKKPIRTYSLGMKQKLNIAQAIFEDQTLLLLDEPTNALDEDSVKNIFNLFTELSKRGKTIFIASHNRLDLEDICDEIYCVNEGKIYRKDNKL